MQNFPENIHTRPKEGHWKFRGGVGPKSQIVKGKYETKLEFPGEYGYFLEPRVEGK